LTDRLFTAGGTPLVANRLTTRYGRVSYLLTASSAGGGYTVHANVTLPASFAAAGSQPPGGLRLRLRAPVEHAGKLKSATVGGKAWAKIDAAAETIDFAAVALTVQVLGDMQNIVATFD
jgi:hypothetical protein